MASEMTAGTRWGDGQPVVLVPLEHFAKLHVRLQARLPLWVIYRPTTREYPGAWVARMHVTLPQAKPTRFVMTHQTVEELRQLLPPGLTCLGRYPEDPPEIEEVWI
jgi:hypothetical protein